MAKARFSKTIAIIILCFLLFLTIIPLLLLLFLSTKDSLDILINFWEIPKSIKWGNFTGAFDAVMDSIGNSLYVCAITLLGSLALGSLSGYVFARHHFPFKNTLFMMLLAVMMIPGILTIVPLYSLITNMGLTHSFWGLILPYISFTQLLGLFICRTFFETLPEELFEAARMDGGSEFYLYSRIALPLSLPVLITVGIITFLAVYNDYLWPLIVLSESQRTFTIAAVNLTTSGRQDVGLSFGAYILGSIPSVIVLMLGMKYYVQGMMSGSVKG
ncbi:MAG TPA: carbohydrate ABC transporter permease [Bacilli bacterium]